MSGERIRTFVESTGFRVFIFIVILANSISIGLEISHADSFAAQRPDAMLFLELFDSICLLIYIAEAAMKLYAYRLKYFKRAWNVFDFLIILLSVLPVVGVLPVPVQFLRVIRLIRVVRILKVISLFEQMQLIVEAIGKSISGVAWTALLLLVLVYVFDVIGVAAFGTTNPDLFGDLNVGAITLVEAALSGWPDFAHDIAVEHPFGYAYFISYIVCSALIVLNVVVGIVVDAIQSSAQAERDEAARGLAPVKAKGHVLLLGFNPSSIAILGELIEANKNQGDEQAIVLLDGIDKTEMENKIDEELGTALGKANINIICRTGCIYDIDVLERCAIASCKSVIVNAEDDFDTIRTIMACTRCMSAVNAAVNLYSIASVQEERNDLPARVAGCDSAGVNYLELISMQNVLARIMVHASRQPGLSAAFREILSFKGNEFYIISDDASYSILRGRTIAEINLFLRNSFAVGVMRNGEVLVEDPNTVQFFEGDALILIEEDDVPLSVLDHEADVMDVGYADVVPEHTMRALILRDRPILQSVLSEFASYLLPGSKVVLADADLDEEATGFGWASEMLADKQVSFSAQCVDIYNKDRLNDLLADFDPHDVLILSDVEDGELDQEDRRIIELVLYLRDYRATADRGFGITCQVNSESTRELIDVAGNDDYIVSRRLAALLMAQISQKREMSEFFNIILSSEGFEIYVKKALHYIPVDVDLDLYTVSASVAKRGDILIGLRQERGGRYQDPVINPAKHNDDGSLKMYRFTENDFLVVLAEDIGFKA